MATDRATRLARALNESLPEDLELSEELRSAFANYVQRSQQQTRLLLSTWISPATITASNKRKRDELIADPLAVDLARRRRELSGNSAKSGGENVDGLVTTIRQLEKAVKEPLLELDRFWEHDRQFLTKGKSEERYRRLFQSRIALEKLPDLAEIAWRFVVMFIDYETESLACSAERLPTAGRTESEMSAAAREFASLSGYSTAEVQYSRRHARGYVELASQFGLGVIIMLGSKMKTICRNLSTRDIELLYSYCEEQLPTVLRRASQLNSSAGDIITDGLSAYGADARALQRGDTALAQLVLRDCSQINARKTLANAAMTAAQNENGIARWDSQQLIWPQNNGSQLMGESESWNVDGGANWGNLFPGFHY